MLFADWCSRRGAKCTALIPYLPAARADRGAPRGASVYGEFLQAYHEVLVIDPHSDKAVREVRRPLRIIDHLPIVCEFERLFAATHVIAPDHGAVDRASRVADMLGKPLIVAEKTRDPETGAILSYKIEIPDDNGRYLVVDDICDGGGTFRLLAERSGLPKSQSALWITHGIFSGKAKDLREHYSHVGCLDSFPSLDTTVPTFLGRTLELL
ncbi:Phosphoribosyl pyrophosphate synthase [Gammaproteobacteria bacterium]